MKFATFITCIVKIETFAIHYLHRLDRNVRKQQWQVTRKNDSHKGMFTQHYIKNKKNVQLSIVHRKYGAVHFRTVVLYDFA